MVEKEEKDKIAIVKQQQAETQKKFLGSMRKRSSHTLFEVNLSDETILPAEYETGAVIEWENAVKGDFSGSRTVVKKENCLYIPALNIKNVEKILKREFNIIFK